MSVRTSALIGLVGLLLVGCALLRPSYNYTNDYLQPQSTDNVTTPVRFQHRLSMEIGSRTISFRTVFEIERTRASFVLLGPMGNRILSVTQLDDRLEVSKETDREFPVDPRRLYVELQLLLWEEPTVRSPYSLKTTKKTGSIMKRMVVRNGTEFIKIRVPSSPDEERVLEHLDASYTLRLELLSRRELSSSVPS